MSSFLRVIYNGQTLPEEIIASSVCPRRQSGWISRSAPLFIILTQDYNYSTAPGVRRGHVILFSLSLGNVGFARTGDRLKLRSEQRAKGKGQRAKGIGRGAKAEIKRVKMGARGEGRRK
jgi:hypothetical protein